MHCIICTILSFVLFFCLSGLNNKNEYIGDIQQAADVVNAGRDLDHQDRYINNQTTKTLLRAGRIEEAIKCISLFTRHEAPVEQNLYDMQCTWYELELADCLKRKGEFGRSLRKYSKLVCIHNNVVVVKRYMYLCVAY